MRKNLYIPFAAFILASLILAACGGTIQTPPPAESAEPADESIAAPEEPADPMAMYAPDA